MHNGCSKTMGKAFVDDNFKIDYTCHIYHLHERKEASIASCSKRKAQYFGTLTTCNNANFKTVILIFASSLAWKTVEVLICIV